MPSNTHPASVHDAIATSLNNNLDWLSGGGEMGLLIRSMDWAKTPLGPLEGWPQSLRTTVSLCLSSTFPILIAWGPERVQLYNESYRPITGAKHPQSMGQRFNECWASALPAVGGVVDRAQSGEGSYIENLRMFLDRHGYLEEAFMTFSFSPIRDESGGIGGLFHPITEVTEKMLGGRRTQALRELSAQLGTAKTLAEVWDLTAQMYTAYELDVPFLIFYRFDEKRTCATLVGTAGMAHGTAASPERVDLTMDDQSVWPLRRAYGSRRIEEMVGLRPELFNVPCGPYEEPPRAAVLIPIQPAGAAEPIGCLVAGVSARRELDAPYRGFYDTLAATFTTAISNARAYEQEQRRAEELAAIDRAKTAFFSNISHEFRTPLTLMMGPMEDALEDQGQPLPSVHRERLSTAHRNSLRLLRLVNTLLDFSRIEAGRMQARFVPVDLAGVTAELASNFESAFERAGLTFTIDCAPLAEAVYVDRDMWEKVVLNLLSNAFKFTLKGGVTVRLTTRAEVAELTVQDTGVGVSVAELPRLFERFHRIEGQKSRSHEGSGIGLALILELIRLHGGEIRAESTIGRGTAFIVSLPFGTAHLPADRIAAGEHTADSTSRAHVFVREALGWLPHDERAPALDATMTNLAALRIGDQRPRVVIADDNPDMRAYVSRLLGADLTVETAATGRAALELIRAERPDLVLSDVMMPELDGFGLLREIRSDEALKDLPVILLSARAGEEARVEGLQAGADDYLTKPFSARELSARVRSNIELARVRRESTVALQESDERHQFLLLLADRLRHLVDPRDIVAAAVEVLGRHFGVSRVGYGEVCDDNVRVNFETDYADGVEHLIGTFPTDNFGPGNFDDLRRGVTTICADVEADPRTAGVGFSAIETRSAIAVPLIREGRLRAILYLHHRDTREWLPDEVLLVQDVAARTWDTLERARAEAQVRELNITLEARVAERTAERDRMWETSPDLMLVIDFEGFLRRVNPAWTKLLGYAPEALVGHHVNEFVLPEHHSETVDAYELAAQGGLPTIENRYRHRDGSIRWISWVAAPAGGVTYATGRDITAEKEQAQALTKAEEALRQAQKMEAVGQLTGGIAHDFNNMLVVVIGNLDLLQRSLEVSEPRLHRLASNALEGAARAAALTQQLLTFARRQPIKPEVIAVNQLVANMSDLLHRTLGGSIKIETILSASLWRIYTDANQLESAILNLAVNARDAMPEDGKLVIETANAQIDDDYAARHAGLTPGQYVTISVTDTGAGMAPEVLAKAFDPFFTTKSVGKGTGLGLSQVHGFIHQGKGHIQILSELTVGTTVKMYLPRSLEAASDPVQSQSDSRNLPKAARPTTVLFVEDEGSVRALGVEALQELGYTVLEADGAASALKLLDAHPQIELLFTDVVMPEINGKELAEDALQRRPGLKVLFATGYTRDAIVHNGVLDPGVNLIGKPFTLEQLGRKIAQVLG